MVRSVAAVLACLLLVACGAPGAPPPATSGVNGNGVVNNRVGDAADGRVGPGPIAPNANRNEGGGTR